MVFSALFFQSWSIKKYWIRFTLPLYCKLGRLRAIDQFLQQGNSPAYQKNESISSKKFKKIDFCGLYYKHVMIVNDDSSIVSKWSFKLIDNPIVVIYDHHRFIIQATGASRLLDENSPTYDKYLCALMTTLLPPAEIQQSLVYFFLQMTSKLNFKEQIFHLIVTNSKSPTLKPKENHNAFINVLLAEQVRLQWPLL